DIVLRCDFCQRNHTAEPVSGTIFLARCFKHVNKRQVATYKNKRLRQGARCEKRRRKAAASSRTGCGSAFRELGKQTCRNRIASATEETSRTPREAPSRAYLEQRLKLLDKAIA